MTRLRWSLWAEGQKTRQYAYRCTNVEGIRIWRDTSGEKYLYVLDINGKQTPFDVLEEAKHRATEWANSLSPTIELDQAT